MLITSAVMTLGFSMVFQIRARLLPFAALGSVISCGIYFLMVYQLTPDNAFTSNLVAAFIATAYSELCAIVLKAPTTLFLIPANIPLVPGSGLYYTMQALIVGDHEEFRAKGANTVYTACGIAIGIIAASLLLYIIKRTVLSAKKHSSDFDQK